MIVEAVKEGVQHFEMGRQTCLACDWSKAGVGFFCYRNCAIAMKCIQDAVMKVGN